MNYFSKTSQKKALNIIYAACAPQPFCLLIIQVHVPRCASCDEHPARQHQCLLRPHHPVVQQCFRFGQICCIKLRSKSLIKTYLLQLCLGPSCNWSAEDTRPLLEVVHIKNRPLFVVYLVVLWVFFFWFSSQFGRNLNTQTHIVCVLRNSRLSNLTELVLN